MAAVGKPRDAALAAAIRHYEERAAHYWPLQIVEVKEESAGRTTPAQVMAKETKRLLARVPAGATLVLCDAQGGQSLNSEAFATRLQAWREEARDVVFVIGGAFGVDPSIREAARLRLALAPWTLPHELARLVLTEQLYRAGTILRGEPYHK
ncbi:MAG: 23S rRNA (pseudouridine(1915)-N(3))-methyltransferase RlmH [Gemmatimonadaceae bacterium]|nr:23S rRNA (pseudouridine(1915)-N(3))-methyltransferase RlmH [Gemmatimonadaceae bacterium]